MKFIYKGDGVLNKTMTRVLYIVLLIIVFILLIIFYPTNADGKGTDPFSLVSDNSSSG